MIVDRIISLVIPIAQSTIAVKSYKMACFMPPSTNINFSFHINSFPVDHTFSPLNSFVFMFPSI